jgi:hypothetical protein
MQGKKSFLLYCDMITLIEQLPDEKAGQLFKMVFEYVNDRTPTTDDLLLKIAFEPIKQQLKRDLIQWLEFIGKQSINGSKGGRPKKPIQTQKTQAFSEKPTQTQSNPKNPTNVTVTVNDTVNVTDIKIQTAAFKFENPNKYPETMYEAFERYWGEPFVRTGKQRWTGEKTWSLPGRLANWNSRNLESKKETPRNTPKLIVPKLGLTQ